MSHAFVVIICDDDTDTKITVTGDPEHGYSCRNYVAEIDENLPETLVGLSSDMLSMQSVDVVHQHN